MAEGTSLLRKHTGKTCIVGSNPTVSARNKKKWAPLREPIFFVPDGGRWDSKTGPCRARALRIAHLLPARRAAPRAVGARRMRHL